MENSQFVIQKLQKQLLHNHTLLFADIDGTIFTAGWQIVKAPFYNLQTSQIIKKNEIPLVLVTGRPYWNLLSDFEIRFYGLPLPDAIVIAAGTIILYRNLNGLLDRDTAWESILSQTQVTRNIHGKNVKEQWNANNLLQFAKEYFTKNHLHFPIKSQSKLIVRITILNLPIKNLHTIISDFQKAWVDGIKIVTTEKLLLKNSLEIFSGDIIIIPKNAGKDEAVKYLLMNYSKAIVNSTYKQPLEKDKQKIHALIYGDANIDVPMLSMKENCKLFSLFQYAVHPTPLAKQSLIGMQRENKNITILEKEGPQVILQTLKDFLNKQTYTKYSKNNYYSPSQNSKARSFIKYFEPILDSLLDKKLTPNDISFLGLTYVTRVIQIANNQSILLKLKGLYLYSVGNIIDILDGIRARQTNNFTENGQLVDVFCDRAKEFYQIFYRVYTFPHGNRERYEISLAAISCILPSIARAQAEVNGKIVKEHDEKGGSMFHRTKKLFLSLLFQLINNKQKSLDIDKEIYQTNIATFQNRLKHSTENFASSIYNIDLETLTDFQRKALERLILLAELLQEENNVIKNLFKDHSEFTNDYDHTFELSIKEFLSMDIKMLRTKFHITDYKLSLKKYLPDEFILKKNSKFNQ